MAFPVVRNRTESPGGTAGTTLTLNFGTNVAGDLCIIFIALSDTAQTITTTESFVNWTNTSATFHVIYKVLDGTEGTSTTVTVGTSTRWAGIAYTIENGTHARSIVPAISTVATGTSTSPNATSCAPTGSAKDYLWISAFRQNGEEADDDTWCTAAPTTPGTFTNLLQKTTGTTGLPATNGSVASAEYQANATSVDAGAFTVAQNLAWRAYTVAVYPEVDGSFTANAVIRTTFTPTGWTADATQKKTQSGVLYIGNNDGTGGAVIAVSTTTITGDFTTNAVLLASSGTKTTTADAVVQKTFDGSTTADAITLATITGAIPPAPTGFWVDYEWIAGAITIPGDFTANATILKAIDGSTTADAVRLASSGTLSTTASSLLLKAFSWPFASDSTLLRTQDGTTAANAVIKATVSFTTAKADAVLLRSQPGSFAAAAVLRRTQPGSFPADAVLKKTVTSPTGFLSEAWLETTETGAFATDAIRFAEVTGHFHVDYQWSTGAITGPVWTTPANGIGITSTPSLAFEIPVSASNLHFHMQLDKVATFDSVDLVSVKSNLDQTGWQYWTGSAWLTVPEGGVPPAYAGNEARYTVQTPLSSGTWYRRVRAG